MRIFIGEFGSVFGMDSEGSQDAELGWGWDGGGFGWRAGMRHALAKSAIEQVERGSI